jgi:acyl-CoA oxidase
MARARGARTALEALIALLEDTPDEGLHLLARLYGVTEVQRDSGWHVATGALPANCASRLGDMIDDLAEQLVPHAAPLVDAFQLTPELLRAPVAFDDYIAAFLDSTGARAQAERAGRRGLVEQP